MVSCSKFTLLMSIYASFALLLAQAEDLKRSGFVKDQVQNIQRHLSRNTVTIREELDALFPSNADDQDRLDNSVDQSRRLIREVEQEERDSVTGPFQSERMADSRRESTRYGSIERSFDRQVERLEDREDRSRSIQDSERISNGRQVERLEDREDRTRSTDRQIERLGDREDKARSNVDSERRLTDRQVERLEDRQDRTRSTKDSETRVFDRRESRRESREEQSEHRGTFRRESRDVSRREATREDRSEYRREDRESRSEQDSRRQFTTRMDEDNVRTERLLRRTLTERVESEGEEPDRKVRQEEIREFRSTESKVALAERNFKLTTFLGQMVSLIIAAMFVNKSTKGGFNNKVKHLFSNRVTVK